MIKPIPALVAAPFSVLAAARALSGTWEIGELPADEDLWAHRAGLADVPNDPALWEHRAKLTGDALSAEDSLRWMTRC